MATMMRMPWTQGMGFFFWTGTLNFEQFKLWMGKHGADNEPNEFIQNRVNMDKYDKLNGHSNPTMVCRIW